MKPSEYVKLAVVTESNNYPEIGARLSQTQGIRLLHAAIGLCTESGEIQDALKKSLFYGKTLDTVNLKEEIGDIMWYVALACDALGADLGEIMETNIAKLKARYGDKFTAHAALNRDLETERKILENTDKATEEEIQLIKTVLNGMLTSRYNFGSMSGDTFFSDLDQAFEHVGIQGALVTIYNHGHNVMASVSYKDQKIEITKSFSEMMSTYKA